MGKLLIKYKVGYVAEEANPVYISQAIPKAIVEKKSSRETMKDLYQLFNIEANVKKFLGELTVRP